MSQHELNNFLTFTSNIIWVIFTKVNQCFSEAITSVTMLSQPPEETFFHLRQLKAWYWNQSASRIFSKFNLLLVKLPLANYSHNSKVPLSGPRFCHVVNREIIGMVYYNLWCNEEWTLLFVNRCFSLSCLLFCSVWTFLTKTFLHYTFTLTMTCIWTL